MAVSGHALKVYAKSSSTDPGGSDEVAGLTDATHEEMIDLFDITSFKSASASAWRAHLSGLNSGSFELSGNAEFGDAPQVLMRSSKRTGTSIWITIDFNPSAGSGVYMGLKVECKVEKYSVKTSVGGKVDFSASFKWTAAPTDRAGA